MILRVLDRLEEWLIATLIAAATALIFFAVLHRYGTGLSIDIAKWADTRGVPVLPDVFRGIYTWLAELDVSWAQELCIYMFIWMAKFGAAYGVRTGIHVGVDVLVNLLPPHSRKRVILFALLCGAFFTAAIAAFGATFVAQMFDTGVPVAMKAISRTKIVIARTDCGSTMMPVLDAKQTARIKSGAMISASASGFDQRLDTVPCRSVDGCSASVAAMPSTCASL